MLSVSVSSHDFTPHHGWYLQFVKRKVSGTLLVLVPPHTSVVLKTLSQSPGPAIRLVCGNLSLWTNLFVFLLAPSTLWVPMQSVCTDIHTMSWQPWYITHVQNDTTLANFDNVLMSLSGAVRGAALSKSEQTSSNLAITAAVFAKSATLINPTIIIEDEVGPPRTILLVNS